MASGLALSGSLVTSYAAILLAVSPTICAVGGIIATLGGLIGASYMKPISANENYDGYSVI